MVTGPLSAEVRVSLPDQYLLASSVMRRVGMLAQDSAQEVRACTASRRKNWQTGAKCELGGC